jgi:MFS family permease
MGIGGLTGAIWLTQRGPVHGLTRVIITNTLIMGATTTAFALSGNFWLGLLFIFMVGFTQTVTGTGTQSLFQMAVEPAMRGRVLSLYMLVWRGTPAIGAILVGWIAERLGLSWAVAGTGTVCMVAWLWSRTQLPKMTPALETKQAPPE